MIKDKIIKRKQRPVRRRGSRMSLTLVLAAFVFFILLAAIGLTSFGLWILTETGVLVDAQDWKRSVFTQSQRKAMLKNAQTTTQFHSPHTLVK